jgi:hypothetical protein
MAVKTIRDEAHELVDALSDDELVAAHRYLGFLRSDYTDLLEWVLDTAPVDDEPTTPEEEAAVEEAREDVRQGRTIPFEEIKRRYLR